MRKIETEITKIRENITPVTTKTVTTPVTSNTNRRYLVELNSYGWDQSDKFVKIFLTFDNPTKDLKDECVTATFTDKSLNVKITNFQDKDYSFVVNNLLDSIDITKSYWKVKKDMVTIYMKKVKEIVKWTHLTSTEKKVKEGKVKPLQEEAGVGDPADPSAGFMNVLKKMYDSGDPEMKRMINKAMHEGQEKRGGGLGGAPELNF